MEQNRNGEERFPLDDAAIAIIAELKEQARITPILIQSSIQAVCQYFARTHNLKGQFSLADNLRELILHRPPESYAEYSKRREEAEKGASKQ